MRGLTKDKVIKDSMLREEDLEQIDSTIYEPKREELIARTILNVKTDIDAGVESFGYDKLSESGEAKITAYGTDDVPLVDADLDRVTQKVVSIEDGFRLKKQELRAARLSGRPVESTKAAVARRVIAETENEIVFLGNSDHDIDGLVNAASINTYDVPIDSDGDGTEWQYKTGLEIIADIRDARKKVNSVTGFNSDSLGLPSEQYQQLEKPINDYNTNTVMSYLNEMGWFDRIFETSFLEGADPDGANDCGLILDTEPENMEIALPLDVERGDPFVERNNDVTIALEERLGGLILRYAKAICRFDLI